MPPLFLNCLVLNLMLIKIVLKAIEIVTNLRYNTCIKSNEH